MAQWHRLIRATPQEVWSVLGDPHQYGRWVVGAHRSWPQGGGWPSEGAELGYALKAGPWTYRGRTVSRRCEPVHRLELEARSGVGSARIAFLIERWGQDTLVVVDEHPLVGPAAAWHNAALDTLLRWRHRGMLARLAEVVESAAKAEDRAHA
ncbi:SRPBCC family protein [Streptomyces sp. NPDC056503]|uniref:SRPBCC family protein n=1 Tax=Streptomyces sp. NPDC056503 TaxID=3345842 RepID=UPI003674087E